VRGNVGHGESYLGRKPDLVADLDVLPLGHDPVRTVDVATDEVLDEVVAVEATPPLPQLGDPRPHVLGRSANGDRTRRAEVGVRDQVIADEWVGELPFCGAPAKLSRPRHDRIRGRHPTYADRAQH
jgi:hypothetical protein